MDFDDDLNMAFEIEEEFSQPDLQEMEALDTTELKSEATWKRPDPPSLDADKHDLVFQQVDVEHYTGERVESFGCTPKHL